MRALAYSNLIHEALDCCFPGERSRNLWRIDNLNDVWYLLILSEKEPDFSQFCEKFSYSKESWETKDYTPLLERLQNDTVWKFRLTANPTVSRSHKKNNHGQIYAHITTEFQMKWLSDRSEKHGFKLYPDLFSVVECKWKHFRKKDTRPFSLLSVTYEGILKITNSELFRNVMINGIGRGKAYGMGLLTVVRT